MDIHVNIRQGCALAEPGCPLRPTFTAGRLQNLRFFIQIICWATKILQVQSTGHPSILLRAQPCTGTAKPALIQTLKGL